MKRWRLWLAVLMVVPLLAFTGCGGSGGGGDKGEVTIGGKDFTEQHLLTKITAVYLKEQGYDVDEAGSMGSTVARKALENGQVDLYWEYTGTALIVYHKKPAITDPDKAFDEVKKMDEEKDLAWLYQSGVNNTYTIMMRKNQAEKLNIQSISDLAKIVKKDPNRLTFATNAEFFSRDDGLKGLEKAYGFRFPANQVKKMDSGILYNALKEGQVDVSVGFATDGRIKAFNLVRLEDDKGFFPAYNASPVVRQEALKENPDLKELLIRLAERLDTDTMVELNYKVDVEHQDVTEVAREWLVSEGLVKE